MILEVKLNWQEKASLLQSRGSVGNHLSDERPVVLDNGRSDDKGVAGGEDEVDLTYTAIDTSGLQQRRQLSKFANHV
jgi:hypothetical protein